MFCNVTALEGLYVTGKHRDRSMQHTCSRHAARDPRTTLVVPRADQAPVVNSKIRFLNALILCMHEVSASGPHVGRGPQGAEQSLVFHFRTTSASTAPRTPRRTCCPFAYLLNTVLRVSRSRKLSRMDSISTSYRVLSSPWRDVCQSHVHPMQRTGVAGVPRS